MPRSRARRIVSGFVALAVVLGTVYGAAALISPVPRLVVEERLPAAESASWSDDVPLPEDGASAIAVDGATPIAAQDAEPRPIAGAARLVLLAVALDAEPLSASSPGPALTIDQEAVARYRELDALNVRAVPVTFGQTWTRRDMIAATLLGAGNNIAELLIEEVFGDLDAYRSAAADWLAAHGLSSTTVVDASGLDSATQSTAADLAVIAGRLLDQPAVAELVEQRPLRSAAGVPYADSAAVLPTLGTRGLASTYSDPAGVCIVATLDVDGERAVVVLLGQPSYPRAEEAVSAVVEGLRTAIRPVEVIAAGEVVAIARSDWGQETELITLEPIVVSSTVLDALELRVEPAVRSTIVRGADAGRLVATLPAAVGGGSAGGNGTEIVVRLESTGAITEPGIAWRFADPFTVLGRWTG